MTIKLMRATFSGALALLLISAAFAQPAQPVPPVPPVLPKDATDATRDANRALRATLPLTDQQAFADAKRGLIEALGEQAVIAGAAGAPRPAWSLKGYEFWRKRSRRTP